MSTAPHATLDRPLPAVGAAHTLGRIGHFTLTLLLWACVGLAVATAAVLSVPAIFGYRVLTVLTGSMEPMVGVGSVVIDEPIRPLQARPGDIITFPDPTRQGRLVTHRLRSLTVRNGKAEIVTKGDANPTVERWSVPLDDELGRVVFNLPKVGYIREQVAGWAGRLAVIAVIALWGIVALFEIWRTPEAEEQDE